MTKLCQICADALEDRLKTPMHFPMHDAVIAQNFSFHGRRSRWLVQVGATAEQRFAEAMLDALLSLFEINTFVKTLK